MAAPVEIANRALTKLGESSITSLADDTKSARVISALYEVVRDAEISAHSWAFARARVKLPAETEKPAFGWQYQYLLPADCLRVLLAGCWPMPDMSNYVQADSRVYDIEGGRILTNIGPALELKYLQRVVDTSLYPPAFVEALACKLAVEAAEILTGSNSKRELAWREYEMAVKTAKRINAIGLPPVMVQDDSWMAAHQTGVI